YGGRSGVYRPGDEGVGEAVDLPAAAAEAATANVADGKLARLDPPCGTAGHGDRDVATACPGDQAAAAHLSGVGQGGDRQGCADRRARGDHARYIRRHVSGRGVSHRGRPVDGFAELLQLAGTEHLSRPG